MIGVDKKENKPVSNLKLLYRILRLKDMKVTHFGFQNCNKELRLAVKPYKKTAAAQSVGGGDGSCATPPNTVHG